MAFTQLLQCIMVESGRRARIEIKDIGPQSPTGHLTMRCRMILEGDDGSVFEIMSESQMLRPEQRLQDALTHLHENGVFLPSVEVIDGSRGFEAVMTRVARRRLGLLDG